MTATVRRVLVEVSVPCTCGNGEHGDEFITALRAANKVFPERPIRFDSERIDGGDVYFTLTEETT